LSIKRSTVYALQQAPASVGGAVTSYFNLKRIKKAVWVARYLYRPDSALRFGGAASGARFNMQYLRLLRVRKQRTAKNPVEIMAALPKMSRQQFSDAIRVTMGLLGDSWDLKQTGFGDESTYKLFLRPHSTTLFKTRDSGPLPTWTRNLRSILPVSQKQILALADSREAYKADVMRQDKTASAVLLRNGLLKTIGLPLNDVKQLLDALERIVSDSKYFVWHDLNLKQAKKYDCSYFSLQFSEGECIISIKSRMELSGIWKEAREEYTLYLTVDELFVLETLIRTLKDDFQIARWCCQAPPGVDLPGKVLRRYRVKGSSLAFIETSVFGLIETLEESRLFETLTHSPIFVPCRDFKLVLQSKSSIQNVFFPKPFLNELRPNLSNWCYDSRHIFDLREIWNELYPGDWH
jgi:hypothetical protein